MAESNSWVAPTPATPKPPAAALRPDALPGPYTTQLPPEDEAKFQSWVKENKVPWQDHPQSDYDMRGYWQAQQSGDPEAKQGANKHFPDTYKTPYHKSFSNESKYATDAAPKWKGNKLLDKNGNIVFDEDATPNDLEARTQKNAKAALPQPELAKPWEEEPRLESAPTSKIGKAYDAAKSWLSEHEQHLSEKVLAPFRQGLDNMAAEIDESPYVKTASPTAQGVAHGVTSLMRAAPVGKDVKETLQAAIVPPELEELGVQLHPEQIIKDAGLVYKGELTRGSGVHMFEHPENPGLTASLHESEITPEAIHKKMQSKLDDFGVTTKKVESAPKQVAKNASGDSAASQEALNRGKSQASQGITHVRRDTRSGKEVPLNHIDAVDAKAGPYEQIVQKNKTGETILDSGAKARPLSGQPKPAGVEPKNGAQPVKKSENSKEVSKLASDYLETLKKK